MRCQALYRSQWDAWTSFHLSLCSRYNVEMLGYLALGVFYSWALIKLSWYVCLTLKRGMLNFNQLAPATIYPVSPFLFIYTRSTL